MNHYETVFILNPVLSEDQIKEAVNKFTTLLTEQGAKFVNQEDWGSKISLPHSEQKSGFYHLLEFKVDGSAVNPLEVAFRRDERDALFNRA